MSWADTVALRSLIQNVPAVASKTFIVEAKNPPPNEETKVTVPYVVLFPAQGTDEAERVTSPRSVTHPEFTGWAVGGSAEQAGIILDLVKAQLVVAGLGVKVSVTGRVNDRLWFESPVPAQFDTSVTPPLHYHIFRTGWRSQPA